MRQTSCIIERLALWFFLSWAAWRGGRERDLVQHSGLGVCSLGLYFQWAHWLTSWHCMLPNFSEWLKLLAGADDMFSYSGDGDGQWSYSRRIGLTMKQTGWAKTVVFETDIGGWDWALEGKEPGGGAGRFYCVSSLFCVLTGQQFIVSPNDEHCLSKGQISVWPSLTKKKCGQKTYFLEADLGLLWSLSWCA